MNRLRGIGVDSGSAGSHLAIWMTSSKIAYHAHQSNQPSHHVKQHIEASCFRLTHHSELYETAPTATTSQPTRDKRFRSHQEDELILNVRGVCDTTGRTGDVALFICEQRYVPCSACPRSNRGKVAQASAQSAEHEGYRGKTKWAGPGKLRCQPIASNLLRFLRHPRQTPPMTASAAFGSCSPFREGKGTKTPPLRTRKATVAQTSCFAS